ncbi:hypothetical protein RJ639_014595 [Escallonia herrerae]|uniref:Fe2OG dioxygenase domain-containing protein n=1 Tax=Escallonia herrerae TaxID=1293975 RepID=A0AA88VFE1_9ASTE|nr:hypothetical protein RJ639_014595 [Escallonia herrerae]
MDELHKVLLKDAFGESSDSEGDDHRQQQQQRQLEQLESVDCGDETASQSIFGTNPTWQQITGINGLWLCRDFLSPQQHSSLLSHIQKEGWFTEASHNQAMRFGDLPAWATELCNSIREVVQFSDFVSETWDKACDKVEEACIFPSELLWRVPLFNQLIVNIYQPGKHNVFRYLYLVLLHMAYVSLVDYGKACKFSDQKDPASRVWFNVHAVQGICAHVDLMRFEDGIAIVSLESSCVMHFSRAESEETGTAKEVNGTQDLTRIPVYLTPGSLVLMWGEARYLWKHEINRNPGFQDWQGQSIDQKRRSSITLRKLSRSE